jgi:PadR family transcriptional regulator, regulatory protein AphA
MSLRYALLGLLREGPASGYDLLRIFKLSLHNAWPATQSQVYTELAKLADAGLLSVTAHGPRGRKEYALTDAGLAELRRWLLETEPDLHPRSDGLLRVFLLGALSHDQAREYLAWLAARSVEDIAALEALEASIDWDDDDLSRYGSLVLEYGKRLSEMSGEWANWAAGQIPRLRGWMRPGRCSRRTSPPGRSVSNWWNSPRGARSSGCGSPRRW